LTRLLIAQAGLWLLCSFQGPSEKGRGRRAVSVDDARAHGLSKLNSMQGSSSAICRALPVRARPTAWCSGTAGQARFGRRARPLGRSLRRMMPGAREPRRGAGRRVSKWAPCLGAP